MKIFSKIKEDKKFIFTGLAIIFLIVLFLNCSVFSLSRPWRVSLGLIFSTFYFLFSSLWLGRILSKIFNLEKEFQFLFGLFLLLYLIAFGLAVPIVLYKISVLYFFIFLFLLTLLISFLNHHFTSLTNYESNTNIQITNKEGIKIPKICYWLLAICYLLALAFLFRGRTDRYILSPWEAVSPLYFYSLIIVSFLTILLIFSNKKIFFILLIIILFSILIHSYLPIVYQVGFGGDRWRHIGAEKLLTEGKIYPPTIFSDYFDLKIIKIPKVFFVGNKTSYSSMWGMNIALSWLFQIDVFYVDIFLGFLLFSIFMPILFFKIGSFFIKNKEFLLLSSFLPSIFFAFQMYGAITIPNSFGFLLFIFLLIVFFSVPDQKKLKLFLFAIPLLYFNYVLYLFLFLVFSFLYFIVKKFQKKRIFYFLISIPLLFLFPLIDSYQGMSYFNEISFKKIFSELFDFLEKIFISQPIFLRFQYMEQDNFLYMQTEKFFTRNNFLSLVNWGVYLSLIIFVFIIYGLFKIKKIENKNLKILFPLILLIILFNQFIASSFMEGNHLFSKRLVLFTSFLFSLFLAFGIFFFLKEIKIFSPQSKIILIALILALTVTATQASGPKIQTVTGSELKAAEFLWQKIKNEKPPYCVLANTWPLLALEAASSREIEGGGFPFTSYEYGQKERVQLFRNINTSVSKRDLEKTLEVTKAKTCYFMTEKKWTLENNLRTLNNLLGEPEVIGDVYLWKYEKD